MINRTQIFFLLLITISLNTLTHASNNNKRKPEDKEESNLNEPPTKKQKVQLSKEEKRIFERFAHQISDAMKPSWDNTIRSALEKLPDKSLSSARDSNGNTFLHWAAFNGYNNTLAYLLKHKALIDAKNNMGSTPLYSAVTGNNIESAQILLKNNADPLSTGHDKLSPLMMAVINRNYDLVNLLLRASSKNVNDTDLTGVSPLGEALTLHEDELDDNDSLQNIVNIIDSLLQHGANPNTPSDSKWPIIEVLKLRLYELLPLFADMGTNFNVKNDDEISLTPLLIAMRDGQPNVVRNLLNYGANPHYQNKNGISGLNFYTTPNNNLVDPNIPGETIAEIQLILDTIPKKGM